MTARADATILHETFGVAGHDDRSVRLRVLILWFAPDTSLGRFLQRWILDRPIAVVARITHGQVLLAILLMLVAGAAIWLLKAEAGPLLGLATPDIGIVIASFEVTTWLDAVAGALLLATSVRWRALNVDRLCKSGPRPRRRPRSRRLRAPRPPANDDERPTTTAAA